MAPVLLSPYRFAAAGGGAYLSAVLADAPQGYWRQGEINTPFSSETGGVTLTQMNTGFTRVSGPLTGSFGVALDGTSQYLKSTYDINASKATIEAWVKTTDTSGIIADDRGVSAKSLTLAMYNTGQVWFGATGDSLSIGIATAANFNDGAWHHIVGVWNGTSGSAFATSQLTIYVDGVAVSTSATGVIGSQNAPLVGTGGYQFGNNVNTTSGFGMLAGQLSRPAFYSGVALSGTRVAAHFAATTVSGYNSAVLADSPTQYWTLDENITPVKMTDISGNGHDGVYGINCVLGATGALTSDTDKAVSYPGNADATVAYAAWMALTSAFSIEAWVKTTATGVHTIADRDASSSRVYQFRQNSGSLELVKISGSVVTASQACSLNDGNWHHVAATYDGSNIRLYNNGSLLGSPTSAPGTLSGTDPLTIGFSAGSGTRFNGPIDEVAYYNTTLSAARIAAHVAAA